MSFIMHLKLKIANHPHATEMRGKKFRTQSLTMFFSCKPRIMAYSGVLIAF